MTIAKFPKLKDIAPVYAVIVVIIYTWSLLRFFWYLPGWLVFLNLNDIASIFAYMVVVNMLESLVVLLIPLLLNMLLPRTWFYDHFTSRSVSLVLLGLLYLVYFDDVFLGASIYVDSPFPMSTIRWIPLVLVGIIILAYFMDRVSVIRTLLDEIANRALVFLYISIPVSLLSLLVVLIRNFV